MSNPSLGFSSGFTSGLSLGAGQSAPHSSPYQQYFQGMTPRTIKESFACAEYLFGKSPQIFAALQKLSEYAITDVTYQTTAETEKKRHRELFEKKLNVKGILRAANRDRRIYGNSFLSINFPFNRFLKCKECQSKEKIEKVEYKFRYRTLTFLWSCSNCKAQTSTHLDAVQDIPDKSGNGIHIIRWDPKRINIEYNPLTGKSEYSYDIPASDKQKFQQGLKSYLNSTPKGFIKAAKEGRVYKFKEGKIFHMKMDAPAGVSSAWGVSPLLIVLDQFLFIAALRKANEAIAAEYLVPFRVLHPAQATGSIDPASRLHLGRWIEETKKNLHRWRRDPLHIQLAPIPLGVTQMGGQGRNLLTFPEIESAENAILAALGVPREFIYGGLSFTGSSVTLRMLENQLMNDTYDMLSLLQWIGNYCADYLKWDRVEYDMVPFKLVDDVQQKHMLVNLNQSERILSKQTLATIFGYDLAQERELQEQEAIDDTKSQLKMNRKIRDLETSIQEKAHREAGEGGLGYDQNQVIAGADQLVQQIMELPDHIRQSQMEALKREDFVMYSVVKERITDYQRMMRQQSAVEHGGAMQ